MIECPTIPAYSCRIVGTWLERRIVTHPGYVISKPEDAISKLLAGESVIVAGADTTRLTLMVDGSRCNQNV